MSHALLLISLQYRIRATLFTLYFATALVVVGHFTGLAEADSVLGCFERFYDNSHLAKHPDQIVKAVKLLIKNSTPGSHYRHDFFFNSC
jgi:hypothetical protein